MYGLGCSNDLADVFLPTDLTTLKPCLQMDVFMLPVSRLESDVPGS